MSRDVIMCVICSIYISLYDISVLLGFFTKVHFCRRFNYGHHKTYTGEANRLDAMIHASLVISKSSLSQNYRSCRHKQPRGSGTVLLFEKFVLFFVVFSIPRNS
ncbi:hypothetical protein B0T19DRAFT_424790 [Cercophora scortea]|uniref:Uncharacterized protein n=1 Tax=Cercophora scortea TaxID=314031 RepID=A0AAE0MDR8_9PEZI|nr:hypothetical protein B0T19DRAFT_424790 [Cercophora scortea]